MKHISVRGARVHNLKNIDVDIPRNRLVVVTGVSGSGKSSLAFDTIYAEGQRRFVESLSAYARQFLERMNKPDVDVITGIPPAIAIEQKTISRNPRSTVGTMTEIYDYLRLLFGRAGTTHCVECGNTVQKDTPVSAMKRIERHSHESDRLFILFPLSRHSEKSRDEEIATIQEMGFFRLMLQSDSNFSEEIIDINQTTLDDEIHKQDLYVLADRLVWRTSEESSKDVKSRLTDSLETSFHAGLGRVVVWNSTQNVRWEFSNLFECAPCRITYTEPNPRLFSFNNAYGACPTCQGFGRTVGLDESLVLPDLRLSLEDDAVDCFKNPSQEHIYEALLREAKLLGIDTHKPLGDFTKSEMNFILNGKNSYIGVRPFFAQLERDNHKMQNRIMVARYRGYTKCYECHGSRLQLSARQVYIGGKTIADIVSMTLDEAKHFFENIQLTEHELAIVDKVLLEIQKRLNVLVTIGIGYLTLDRLAHTLSGGEHQRVHLATSIGSALVGALYVLDEPSIGLHPRDTERMIRVLKRLRDLGNSVIVVEHDAEIMRMADYIVDVGPVAGENGGRIVAQGTFEEILREPNSLTGQYLSKKKTVTICTERRKPKRTVTVVKPTQNNLKGENIEIPLGCMAVVTGVSGSGKSTLVHDVLAGQISAHQGLSAASEAGRCKEILGIDTIPTLEIIDQSPIGRSPRSTPATYTKAFDGIREIFAATPAARQLGWKAGHFSFNVEGGRCDVCEGDGVVKVEMQFLADLYLECEACHGTRYRTEAREITFKGRNIVEVLAMTVDEALDFFAGERKIVSKLQVLHDVGLGYIRLGQPANTLSGGESQRIKLASHMQGSDEPRFFIFDEPTTGLHFDDIAKLLTCFHTLVEKGHSLAIVEHNLDVIASADYVIDLGPDAGDKGGYLVACGTPEQVAQIDASYTGQFLRDYFAHQVVR